MFSFCFRGVTQLNSSNPIGSASKTARFGASVFVKELIKDSIECCVSVQGLYAAGCYSCAATPVTVNTTTTTTTTTTTDYFLLFCVLVLGFWR